MIQSMEYKVATTEDEFNQIHQLNYETFVKEIPQHERNESKQLVDQFHDENTYMIAKHGDKVVGMIAVRGQRPFSLDKKIKNMDEYFEGAQAPCELRLLSVRKEYRKRTVFFGLIDQMARYCLDQKYDVAFISGTDRELVLYQKLGFQPFAEMVGTKEASYQPMKLTKPQFVRATQAFHRILARHEPVSFLSGPVPMTKEVKNTLTQPTISHRSSDFIEHMCRVQEQLCSMTKAKHSSVLVGTGTLANDVVAQQIKQLNCPGVILATGEFGERLTDHAERAGISFYVIQKQWNTPISESEIRRLLEKDASIGWIWTVHCETSTGYLSSLECLKRLASEYDVHLCVDACSSLGVDEVDLSDVYLASSVSGKGLGSYPGLALVFHSYKPLPNKSIPRYLDLGMYTTYDSTPYTHSSNSLEALKVALEQNQFSKEALMKELRNQLVEQNWSLLGDESYSNGILTIEIPEWMSSIRMGNRLKKQGIMINYESGYLRERNWIQIALMGHVTHVDLVRMCDAFQRLKKAEMNRIQA